MPRVSRNQAVVSFTLGVASTPCPMRTTSTRPCSSASAATGAAAVASIEAVAHWIQQHGGWEDNLLLITADHETGMLWGPDSEREPFQPLEDRGAKKVPGHRYLSKKHSNSFKPRAISTMQCMIVLDRLAGLGITYAVQ